MAQQPPLQVFALNLSSFIVSHSIYSVFMSLYLLICINLICIYSGGELPINCTNGSFSRMNLDLQLFRSSSSGQPQAAFEDADLDDHKVALALLPHLLPRKRQGLCLRT